jgi:hypothetical protein
MEKQVLENLRYLVKEEKLPNISNADYVKKLKLHKVDKIKALEILKEYGDVKWWLSSDNKIKAYAQINERQLVISMKDYGKGMDNLIKRDTYVHPLMRPNGLRDEANLKMDELIENHSNQA